MKRTLLAFVAVLTLSAADVDVLNLRARTSLKQARAADSAASLADAEDAVHNALQLAPDDFEARKLEVKVLLARRQFREALDRARPINHGTPDDVEAWGLVSDAALGLGDYSEAEHSAQWMLNLRSTNVGGLERGARLRELFGDNDGAREFWESAMRLTLADEEQRAWLATQMASLIRRTGHAGQAESLLRQVLSAVPGYQPALAEMARVLMQQHRYDDAVTLLRERYQKVPRPDVQFELARALQMAGRATEAQTAYQAFERAARTAIDAPYNYNHELAAYYTDRALNPAEALRIAKIEMARRQDVETLDAYAWALQASGDLAQAQTQMDRALAVGLRDASFFYRAGAIASQRKDAPAATRYFNDSLAVSPESDAANAARGALKEMNPRAD
ncbi:MAG: tetratricopeptide repeat protein [Bryobacteraceae bacterium]|jgi:tetratricopeptide (TPR) repeat protein